MRSLNVACACALVTYAPSGVTISFPIFSVSLWPEYSGMGNKSSNLEYAEWRWGNECGHSYSAYKVTEIRWIRVPMSNDFMRGVTQTGRVVVGIATLGFSAWVNGGIKDLSHECIEILAICQCCGNSQRFTAEIEGKGKKGSGGKGFYCGYYSLEYDTRHTYKPSSMTLAYVKEKYNEMGSSYNFVFENCSHWCSELWNRL